MPTPNFQLISTTSDIVTSIQGSYSEISTDKKTITINVLTTSLFIASGLIGNVVYIGSSNYGTIIANTTTTITVSSWISTPAATGNFFIAVRGAQISTTTGALTTNYRDIPVNVLTSSGSLVVVGVTSKGSGSLSSVSDTEGNTYTVVQSANKSGYAAIAYSKITSSLTTSSKIRVTLSGTGQRPLVSVAASKGLGTQSVTSNTYTYSAQVNPNTIVTTPSATGGYAVAVIQHVFSHNANNTSTSSGSSKLDYGQIAKWTGNSTSSTQLSFVWKNLLITSSSTAPDRTLGVYFTSGAVVEHNAVAVVFPVSSAPASYPQVIDLF